ncbi:unnamed protein product [Allacma fusca]|uniref:Uncharacterized protein n=1 Tax=Allacma fusca TaxID=39272 RepID=A0A8J2NLC6_9HEXA|nr:unnamed protein product [Allacma fusca]
MRVTQQPHPTPIHMHFNRTRTKFNTIVFRTTISVNSRRTAKEAEPIKLCIGHLSSIYQHELFLKDNCLIRLPQQDESNRAGRATGTVTSPSIPPPGLIMSIIMT